MASTEDFGIDDLIAQFRGMREDFKKLGEGEEAEGGEAPEEEQPAARQGPPAGVQEVFVRILVRRVFNVDTVAQTFGVQFALKLMWKAPENEELPEEGEGDWEPGWQPKYRVRRVMSDNGKETVFDTKVVGGETWVVADHDCLMDISEQLELQSFPVDVQDLSLEIVSNASTDKVVWKPWPKEEGEVFTLNRKSVALNDFALVEPVPITCQLHQTDGPVVSSIISVDVKVARKANYYILNVAVVMMIIVSFSLTAWATHPGDIASRQGVDLTLILTAVAFKLVLASMLPNVSYVTLLDVYVMSGFLFLTAVTTCHTQLPFRNISMLDMSALTRPPDNLPDRETEPSLLDDDKISFYVFLSVWVAFNFFYFLGMFIHGKRLYGHFSKEAKEEQAKFDAEIEAARAPPAKQPEPAAAAAPGLFWRPALAADGLSD